MPLTSYRLSPPDDPVDDVDGTRGRPGQFPEDGEALSYHVEIWDERGAIVDQIVATSISPSIGYAAYYAATREFPRRTVILRHKGRVISRWAPRTH